MRFSTIVVVLFAIVVAVLYVVEQRPSSPTAEIKAEVVSALAQADTADAYHEYVAAWRVLDGVAFTMNEGRYRWSQMPVIEEEFRAVQLGIAMHVVAAGMQLLRMPYDVRFTIPIEVSDDSTVMWFGDQTAEVVTTLKYVLTHQDGLSGWKTVRQWLVPDVLVADLRLEVLFIRLYANLEDQNNAGRLGHDLWVAAGELGIEAGQLGLTEEEFYRVANGFPLNP